LRGTLLPQAQHLVEASRVAFENAQGSLGDALSARLLLLEAELDETRAVRELELARVDLETASGDVPDFPGTAARPLSTSPSGR
jgi:outer membrane protein TolC